MLKKYTGLALALLFILCEAQELDENEMRKQLEELDKHLHAASKDGSDAAALLDNIEQQFKYKCPDVFDSVKEKFGYVKGNVNNLVKQINIEIVNVVQRLIDLGNKRGFPEYKKKIEKLLIDSYKTFNEIGELTKMLNTCSASWPDDKTVPQTVATANIPLAPVTLTTAAAFIAIKLAFH